MGSGDRSAGRGALPVRRVRRLLHSMCPGFLPYFKYGATPLARSLKANRIHADFVFVATVRANDVKPHILGHELAGDNAIWPGQEELPPTT